MCLKGGERGGAPKGGRGPGKGGSGSEGVHGVPRGSRGFQEVPGGSSVWDKTRNTKMKKIKKKSKMIKGR